MNAGLGQCCDQVTEAESRTEILAIRQAAGSGPVVTRRIGGRLARFVGPTRGVGVGCSV
jgi:hypothetical protein